jgi:toluene monooxygenase system protein E
LREVLEHLLVTYDWGEALVALNLVVKPLVDTLFTDTLGAVARERGDYVLQQMLGSLAEDCVWQRSWTQALMQLVLRDTPANQSVISGWIDNWRRRAATAIEPLAVSLGAPGGADSRGATARLDEHLRLCGL